MADLDFEREEAVVAESKPRLKKPPLYKVLLHNDDYTSMEFVVFILRGIFQRSEVDAVRIMLLVHNQGVGVAGVYTYEIAEAKIAKVTTLAREQEFPLLCSLEPD
ncbi:MAG TPA: ATP-dependent Clp protease adaptor ClpS [Blastocatellia bacterium]|nr:ATP-dependent Clp protease adaptor ClpS [Blastocatellia bacterium]